MARNASAVNGPARLAGSEPGVADAPPAEAAVAGDVVTWLDRPGQGPIASGQYPHDPVRGGLFSAQFLRESRAVPVAEAGGSLIVAAADAEDAFLREALALVAGSPVRLVRGRPEDIAAALDRLHPEAGGDLAVERGGDDGLDALGALAGDGSDVARLRDLASEAPVIRLVNGIIDRARAAGASDIHIEPAETHLAVRTRIDGVMVESDSPPIRLAPAIVSRLKIMARLDIAERRRPQDGRIRLGRKGAELDIRVSVLPAIHGESVVLRLLDQAREAPTFKSLGMDPEIEAAVIDQLDHRHGIVLVTGPTGSGKSTTLYAGIDHLNDAERKIITVEDPVEYQIGGITQLQVKPDIGLDFAGLLRSILRHDPDVLMIGEMRDAETARIAVQAAMTGHLVLSTLHTNSAIGAVTRLIDMGVEDFLITATVNAVVAQRLVRCLCPHCRVPDPHGAAALVADGLISARQARAGRVCQPVGCDSCGGRGFAGRIGLYEMLKLTDRLRRLVMDRADPATLVDAAREEGLVTLHEAGIAKVLAGETTLAEVHRVTRAAG